MLYLHHHGALIESNFSPSSHDPHRIECFRCLELTIRESTTVSVPYLGTHLMLWAEIETLEKFLFDGDAIPGLCALDLVDHLPNWAQQKVLGNLLGLLFRTLPSKNVSGLARTSFCLVMTIDMPWCPHYLHIRVLRIPPEQSRSTRHRYRPKYIMCVKLWVRMQKVNHMVTRMIGTTSEVDQVQLANSSRLCLCSKYSRDAPSMMPNSRTYNAASYPCPSSGSMRSVLS